ncbi:MAG TPA: aminotransferase class III-fold pyridoxal phosphate-dependent enzyme [Spirochaetia bacterium]|nr:aminotransferase class III-fold pyridoxal phosphate-dependent enzyme [Spirochaetia bacterium]
MNFPKILSQSLSLTDILGDEYISCVIAARSAVTGQPVEEFERLAEKKVELFPESFARRQDELLSLVGKKVCDSFIHSASGAATASFKQATNTQAAPVNGFGFIRIGEDGRAYLTSKSEHYHASLGHSFPGFELLTIARTLGIDNMAHNNYRGNIERTLEEELIRLANGIKKGDRPALEAAIVSREPHVLNRIINLQTGSLVVEAALKMALARFYPQEDSEATVPYGGKTPVILVIGDNDGGLGANYHGITILTQMMRGVWPSFYRRLEEAGIFVVKPVSINDIDHFKRQVETYDSGKYKVAAFFHEIVLMNYGGIKLDKEYLQAAYQICHEHDIPVVADEIQSCVWYPGLFLFREYGLRPDFVSVGKGFPGGQYSASKIITTAPLDNLSQFGALVTNGQEDLAALSYLITIAFAEANEGYTTAVGTYYENELKKLAKRYPDTVMKIEGLRHLSAVFFHDPRKTVSFCSRLNERGIDISAHTYKANCPPSALTKLPLTTSPTMVDFLVRSMDEVLKTL